MTSSRVNSESDIASIASSRTEDELDSISEPDDEVAYAFGVGRPGTGWPRRLLHVPTMTSYRHERGHYYGAYLAPKYNVLSYTWGRWQQPQGLSLSVKGVTWKIPPVREDCFSVAAFANALRVASEGVEFVWVDIACIDQEDSRTKMAEVGRQAQIFNKAETAYVWLHSLSTKDLRAYVKTASSVSIRLQEEIERDSEKTEDSRSSHSGEDNVVPECLLDEQWVNATFQVLSDLQEEPWFSSLWTLQEMFLVAPTLLSREAECVDSPFKDDKASTRDLQFAMEVVQDTIESCICDSPSRLPNIAKLESISNLINKLGLDSNIDANACVLYSASRFRVTTYPLDRVYGIMQVFGFKLGASKNPGHEYTLEELEYQLGAALADRSPVWSQLWVRSRVAEIGRNWLIDPHCTFPARLSIIDSRPESFCSITVDEKGHATFKGGACGFPSLAEIIQRTHKEGQPFVRDLLFDVSSVDFGLIPKKMLDRKNDTGTWFEELSRELVRLFGERLNVLFLGVHSSATDYDIDISIGLLVVKTNYCSVDRWQRIGLCLWTEQDEDSTADESIWKQVVWALG